MLEGEAREDGKVRISIHEVTLGATRSVLRPVRISADGWHPESLTSLNTDFAIVLATISAISLSGWG